MAEVAPYVLRVFCPPPFFETEINNVSVLYVEMKICFLNISQSSFKFCYFTILRKMDVEFS